MVISNMTEKEKMLSGEIYDANSDQELISERLECKESCQKYNRLSPREITARKDLIKKLLGTTTGDFLIEQPFYCDYGYNIRLGRKFYSNFNLVILDEAPVTFGDNVFVGPNCGFYTACHPIEAEERNKGLEYARPIRVGDNVWFGAQVVVLPGVTIGDNCVIGAGSVVSRDIPSDTVAVGNPCRVIRDIEKTK